MIAQGCEKNSYWKIIFANYRNASPQPKLALLQISALLRRFRKPLLCRVSSKGKQCLQSLSLIMVIPYGYSVFRVQYLEKWLWHLSKRFIQRDVSPPRTKRVLRTLSPMETRLPQARSLRSPPAQWNIGSLLKSILNCDKFTVRTALISLSDGFFICVAHVRLLLIAVVWLWGLFFVLS